MFNFNNVGKKIKMLAEILSVSGILITVGLGLYYIASYIGLSDYYRSQNLSILISGIILIIVGPLASWVGCFLLYGFGELIDATCDIRNTLKPSNGNERDWINK